MKLRQTPQFTTVPIAGIIPFDNSTNGFTAQDAQSAIEEAKAAAGAVPKLAEFFNTDLFTDIGDLVYVNGTNSVTVITDNSETTIPNGIFGVVLGKPNPTRALVLFGGIIDGYSGFTSGLPIFVSATGEPTQTVPVTPGVVQQIGFAISATAFFVQLMLPTIRS